jgi:hypothetical protein
MPYIDYYKQVILSEMRIPENSLFLRGIAEFAPQEPVGEPDWLRAALLISGLRPAASPIQPT